MWNIETRVISDVANCPGPYNVTYQSCFDYATTALDNCNYGGENMKQGGYVVQDGCLAYIVDPNPDMNQGLHYPGDPAVPSEPPSLRA